jgi:tRNA (guanine-N7-)-methyltransferase
MSRSKLKRFQANQDARNVVEPGKDIYQNIKGRWHDHQFENQNRITLELGCGRGEYTVGLAKVFPDRNFIGVDIKGSRIWKGSQISIQEGLENTAFLRTQIVHINQFFEKGEVDEAWITFPDPRPRDKDEKRRLVSPRFIELYREIMKPGSKINLKTDNHDFYLYGLEVCKELNLEILKLTDDLYSSEYLEDHFGIQTTYERKFLAEGVKINYLQFRI